jgi:predicted nucleotidyltransferase
LGEFELYKIKAAITQGMISSIELGYRNIIKVHLTIHKTEESPNHGFPEEVEEIELKQGEHLVKIFYVANKNHIWGLKFTTSTSKELYIGPVTLPDNDCQFHTFNFPTNHTAGFCSGIFESKLALN